MYLSRLNVIFNLDDIKIMEDFKMKSVELKKLTNDKILFDISKDSLLVKSLIYRYADFLKLDDIEAIEQIDKSKVRISIPTGSSMGDHEIIVDLSNGLVVADGKKYDDDFPNCIVKSLTKKTRSKTFAPSINGFSIKSVSMMPSEDGYACYCKVYFNGKKVGDFVDKGDGSEYSFYADFPYSALKIEKTVHGFPPIKRNYGLGLMEIPYDMNQMVNDLIEMKEIYKELKKIEGMGRDYVLVDEWGTDIHLATTAPSEWNDKKLENQLKKSFQERSMKDYVIRRYRDYGVLCVTDKIVVEEALKM